MKRRWLVIVGALLLAVAFGVVVLRKRAAWRASVVNGVEASEGPSSARVATRVELAEVAYDGRLGQGWDDWGWGPHQLGAGPAQVTFAGYGGILLHHAELPSQYAGVVFRFKAPASWGNFMHVSLKRNGTPDSSFPVVPLTARHVAAVEDGWREALVPWSELNPKELPFDRVLIGSRSLVGSEPVLLDRIGLTKRSEAQANAGKRSAALRVLCDAPSHRISELIYGASSDTSPSGVSALRLGGNPMSRLNWDHGFWNTGSDWFFENGKREPSLFSTLASRAQQGRSTAIVVPMLGWVSKDATSVGFPVSKLGAQRAHDPNRADAGDGMSADGKPLAPGDPTTTSVPAPPELIEGWVRRLVDERRGAGNRGTNIYILDNEPSLWNVTHRDVYPQPLSYDELLERTIRYASAVRRADPNALIAGPAEWGWLAYQYSAVDREAGYAAHPDRAKHGGVPLVAWYLKKLAEHEKATGTRLLDFLDLHFYPAADRLHGDNAATDPQTAALRLRSTRALWDPTYHDESWIAEAVRLIPRMKDWVRTNNPGVKLAIGEWSFGAESHISGGLATAEALGRFGEQGLDAAFHWGDLKEGTPGYWAFRAFRDFDGKGARFQDVSLSVKEASEVSLFASRDAGSTQLVLVLINRSASSEVDAHVDLQACNAVTASRLFSYDTGSSALREGKARSSARSADAVLTPYSFNVLELKLASKDGANKLP